MVPAARISARIRSHKTSLCSRSATVGFANSTRTLEKSPQIRCNHRMTATRPVVLITGAAKRVGAQIARTLHGTGYDVALHYRHSRAEMDALIAGLESARPASTLAIEAELADLDAIGDIVEKCTARFGRI